VADPVARELAEVRRLSEDPPNLEDLGRQLSISGEPVRQIEMSAFEKVKRAATRRLRPAVLPAQEVVG
jgi:RNA polymerase sigma-32 factor